MIPAPLWRPTGRQYHAADGWSASRLRLFREAPQEAFRRFVSRTLPPPAPTAARQLGQAVHALLRHAADGTPARVDRCEHGRKSKRFKDRDRLDPDGVLLTDAEYRAAIAMTSAILEPLRGTPERPSCAELARHLLVEAPGIWEWAHRWSDGPIGLRCMVDRLAAYTVPTVVEFKTGREREPARIGYAVRDRQYHVQGLHNLRGVRAATGIDADFVLVWIVNEPPHEVTTWRLFDASSPWLEDAERILDGCLMRLSELMQDPTGSSWRHEREFLDGPMPVLDAPFRARR